MIKPAERHGVQRGGTEDNKRHGRAAETHPPPRRLRIHGNACENAGGRASGHDAFLANERRCYLNREGRTSRPGAAQAHIRKPNRKRKREYRKPKYIES